MRPARGDDDPQARPGDLSPPAARLAVLPAGHPQGYADCFDLFVADVYAAVAGGEPRRRDAGLRRRPARGADHRRRARLGRRRRAGSTCPPPTAGGRDERRPLLEVRGHRQAVPRRARARRRGLRRARRRGALPARPQRRRQVDADQVRLGRGRARPRARSSSTARRCPTGEPSESLARGIATIYQELDLVEDLSVAESVFLGHEPRRARPARPRGDAAGDRRAARAPRPRGHPARTRACATLRPPPSRWSRSPARCRADVRLLIMDEPSAILDGKRDRDAVRRRAPADRRRRRRRSTSRTGSTRSAASATA